MSEMSHFKSNTTFIISAGAAGEIGYSEVDFWAADDVYYFVTPDALESKFLYHFLLTQKSRILSQVRRASIPRLSKSVVEKLQIPIPPLPIQKEIVRILDTFTELTTELTHRKKQYNHYRDQLLSFQEGTTKSTKGFEIEWKTLGEIVIIKTGASVSKDLIAANPGNFPVINSGREPLGYINQWNTENDPIGLTTRGAGVGSVTWQEGKYFRGNLNYSVSIKDRSNLNLRFFYHSLLHRQRDIQAICTYDGIPALNAGNLKELKIPIPYGNNPKKSLIEQERIVAILDKFDTFTHSISQGLPREIELRQKQYEHYRNLLLSFPKPKEVVHV